MRTHCDCACSLQVNPTTTSRTRAQAFFSIRPPPASGPLVQAQRSSSRLHDLHTTGRHGQRAEDGIMSPGMHGGANLWLEFGGHADVLITKSTLISWRPCSRPVDAMD